MLNQPFTALRDSPPERTDPATDPRRRLQLLGMGMLIGVMLIGVRVWHVQAVVAREFLIPWEKMSTVEVAIPARNGRILTRDGAVLARDETRYDIAVDYRWLEQPFDPVWLRREVYAQLGPHERNDPHARQRIEEELHAQRKALFHRLSELTGKPEKELLDRAARIQRRISTMAEAVERRRAEANQAAEVQAIPLDGSLASIWEVIRSELTNPPRRSADDPIILKEELEPHLLIQDVPLPVVATIQSMPHLYPGVHVQGNSLRVYPQADVAAHLIGLRRPAPTGERRRGEGGIEQQYDERLQGLPGKRRQDLNRRGDVVNQEIVERPRDGEDVILTLDSRLQQTAERLLDAALAGQGIETDEVADAETASAPQGGAVIIMDLWTGDVLAAAAAPRFSLQTALSPTAAEWETLVQHPQQPFFPRALRMAIPPGSVFKVVTSAAALELGKVRGDEIFECRGYLHSPGQHRCLIFRRYGIGHGEIRLDDALCQSCNVFFYDLADRMGHAALLDWTARFGFGQPTGIDLPDEHPGLVPSPTDPHTRKQWYPGSALQIAIGQGGLLATPLQVTRMMGAIGNGGYLVTPQLVLSRQSEETSDESEASPRMQKIPGLSDATVATLAQGLEMVVHHPRGTGIAALTPSMTIAAKTGTAEVGGRSDHAWFAGYAPVEAPRIAFCVVLEHGGSGGEAAGPIVRELMTEMLGLGLLQPQWDDQSTRRENSTEAPLTATTP